MSLGCNKLGRTKRGHRVCGGNALSRTVDEKMVIRGFLLIPTGRTVLDVITNDTSRITTISRAVVA
jgi:hypothetical protein